MRNSSITQQHLHRVWKYRKAGSATALDFVGPRPRPCRPLVQLPLLHETYSTCRPSTEPSSDSIASERLLYILVASGWIVQRLFHRERECRFQYLVFCFRKRTQPRLQNTFPRAGPPSSQQPQRSALECTVASRLTVRYTAKLRLPRRGLSQHEPDAIVP